MLAAEACCPTAFLMLTLSRRDLRSLIAGLLFVSPWLFGFAVFLVYPLLANFQMGMTDYSGFGDATWIGLKNYQELLADPLFWESLYNTLFYTVFAVPLGVAVAILIAIAMNQKVREIPIYRALIYLPSIAPTFALSMMMIWLMNPRYGLVNYFLSFFGVPSINWLGDPRWSKIAIILLAQLGAGPIGLIFLAAMRAIPTTVYDAASLDGASSWKKFWHITLPLITPAILYDIIIGIGLGLQIFVPAYIMTQGGPLNSTTFIALYIYNSAFKYSRFGFAAAMSGILFLINALLAITIFRSSRLWVNYHVE
jgi:multiple sugar transport system permease protein